MTTLDFGMRDILHKLGEKGRLTVLIDLLLRGDTLRHRCYPSVKTIAKDTGLSTSVVDDALDWLVAANAIVKVSYRSRIGAKEKKLPNRQSVYQLTGIVVVDGKAYPYLYMNDTTRAMIDDLVQHAKGHISENEISDNEILESEISHSETKVFPSTKGNSRKKKDNPPVAKPRYTDLIKAWLDAQGSKNSGAYKNVDIQASAKDLYDSGITSEDMTTFTLVKKKQEFWQDKFIGFEHIANEILAWKEKKKPRPAAPVAMPLPASFDAMPAPVVIPAYGKEQPHD